MWVTFLRGDGFHQLQAAPVLDNMSLGGGLDLTLLNRVLQFGFGMSDCTFVLILGTSGDVLAWWAGELDDDDENRWRVFCMFLTAGLSSVCRKGSTSPLRLQVTPVKLSCTFRPFISSSSKRWFLSTWVLMYLKFSISLHHPLEEIVLSFLCTWQRLPDLARAFSWRFG